MRRSQVSLEALASKDGGGYLPSDLIPALARRLSRDVQSREVEKARAAAAKGANQTLRLYGCVYRSALRRCGHAPPPVPSPPHPPAPALSPART